MEIRLLKLFSIPEEGCELESVVAYKRYIWRIKDGKIVEKRHILYINLWFILLSFKWITKSKDVIKT